MIGLVIWCQNILQFKETAAMEVLLVREFLALPPYTMTVVLVIGLVLGYLITPQFKGTAALEFMLAVRFLATPSYTMIVALDARLVFLHQISL